MPHRTGGQNRRRRPEAHNRRSIGDHAAAGLFANAQKDYNYPNLVVGAVVDLDEVVVKLVTAEDTFDITMENHELDMEVLSNLGNLITLIETKLHENN